MASPGSKTDGVLRRWCGARLELNEKKVKGQPLGWGGAGSDSFSVFALLFALDQEGRSACKTAAG